MEEVVDAPVSQNRFEALLLGAGGRTCLAKWCERARRWRASLWLTRLLARFLFGVKPADVVIFAGGVARYLPGSLGAEEASLLQSMGWS